MEPKNSRTDPDTHSALRKINKWFENNGLKLNVNKTHVFRINDYQRLGIKQPNVTLTKEISRAHNRQ